MLAPDFNRSQCSLVSRPVPSGIFQKLVYTIPTDVFDVGSIKPQTELHVLNLRDRDTSSVISL